MNDTNEQIKPIMPLAPSYEDRLYAFAGLAMQKLILMKPPKGGHMDVECDTRMAWELAYAMMETKEKMDAAGARKVPTQ